MTETGVSGWTLVINEEGLDFFILEKYAPGKTPLIRLTLNVEISFKNKMFLENKN
jgi:hypothetical protein